MGKLAGLLEAARRKEAEKHTSEIGDAQREETKLMTPEAIRIKEIQDARIKEWNKHKTIGI